MEHHGDAVHPDCIGCVSQGEDPTIAVLALLRALSVDVTVEEAVADLCFEHRRMLGLHVHEAPDAG